MSAALNEDDLIVTSSPPDPAASWMTIIKTLTFWAVIVVGTIVLVQYVTHRRRNDIEISYNEFVQQLEQRNITAMQVTNRRVRGHLKAAVRQGNRSSSSFATTLPFEPSDTWVAGLVEKGVEVRGQEARSRRPWPVVVLSFLPYLLILFVVIVMLRRWQTDRQRGP